MDIKKDQDLGKYTTMGIGGKIKYMLFPTNGNEFVEAVAFCIERDLNYFILAGGSNTVFSDDVNYDQAVINLCQMKLISENNGLINIGPGFVLQDLVDFAQKNKLSGVTGLNRVPGTVGGAVIGNAGAYGCEICDSVKSVSYLELDEVIIELKKGEEPPQVYSKLLQKIDNTGCKFGYRDSFFKSSNRLIVTEIELQLEKNSDFDVELAEYYKIAEIRDNRYPVGFASPGSMFKNILFDSLPDEVQKNIPNDWVVYGKLPVGKLIEEVIGKGYRVGGIGNKADHANILQNYDNGTMDDILEFKELVQEKVYDRFSINPELEIRLVPPNFADFQH